jgi:hypothetical protein
VTKAGTGIQVELYAAPEKNAPTFWTRLFAPRARPTTAAL